jgi:hypothetical protein
MFRRCVAALFILLTTVRGARSQTEPVAIAVTAGVAALAVASIARLMDQGSDAAIGNDIRIAVRDEHDAFAARGTLTGFTRDSIELTANGSATRYARRNIRSMVTRMGTEGKWAQGWGVGLLAGGGAFGAFGFAFGDSVVCDEVCLSRSESGVVLGIAGAVVGSTVGAIIGASIEGDRWSRVRRLRDPRVGVVPIVTISPVIGRTTGLMARISY